uniref:Nsp1_C domain-containing protein n=1 Tax=Mesocestoides corti TaxID=53468 RepID=A0A5K3FBP1_MESCO
MSGFSFGTPTTSVSSKPSGFSFGLLGTGQNATTASPSFSFGSATTTASTVSSSFSLGTPVATTNATSTTATLRPGFGLPALGNNPTTTSTSVPGIGISSGLSTPAAPAFGTQATTSTTSAAKSMFGFGLDSKPAVTTASTAVVSFAAPATTVAAPVTSNFAFGSRPTSTSVATTAAAPATSSISFAATTAAISGTTTTTGVLNFGGSTTTTPSFSLDTAKFATTNSPAVASTTSTTSVPVSSAAQPSANTSLTYRQLEDMVNKWTYELDEQSRNFSVELKQLNTADRVLTANAEKISDLHAKIEACKAGQSRIEQELEFVESQQRILEDLLEPLEQAAADLPPSQQHADAEREAIFQVCINTDLELGQLLGELKEMAERVNAVTADLESATGGDGDGVVLAGSTDKTTNVIGQVTHILNSHMHSLNWLNQNTQELMEKMKFLSAS